MKSLLTGLSRAVVAARGDAEPQAGATSGLVAHLQQNPLCHGFEAGDVLLGILREEGQAVRSSLTSHCCANHQVSEDVASHPPIIPTVVPLP